MQQKTSCDAMIDEKNKLINDFQQVKYILLNFIMFFYYMYNKHLCLLHRV